MAEKKMRYTETRTPLRKGGKKKKKKYFKSPKRGMETQSINGEAIELTKIFKTYGITAAAALREREKRNAIRKANEKKRGR